MENEYNIKDFISRFKFDIREWLRVKIELAKIEVVEKGSRGASLLIYGMFFSAIILFALFFCFLALGFLLSDWVNSLAGGFALVVLVYLLIAIILVVARKSILSWCTNLFIKEVGFDLLDESKDKTLINK
jgi:uncharacterized membrane protein YqjE